MLGILLRGQAGTTSLSARNGFNWALASMIWLVVASVSPGTLLAGERTAAQPTFGRADGPVVAVGGDVNLGRRQNAVTAERGPADALASIPELADADLSVVNLESVVATTGAPAEKGESGPYYFRGRPETLAVLAEAGIDVVGTANNHSGDYGDAALLEQATLLDGMNLGHTGSGPDRETACAPVLRRAGQLTVAVFSVDATMPYFAATGDEPGTCYLPLDDTSAWRTYFEPKIASARRFAHVVLVAVHAGPNYETRPRGDEVASARALIEAGADAILGSSAHVLQGVEIFNGRPILYDTGNLLFDSLDGTVGSAVFSLVIGPAGVRQAVVAPLEVRYGSTRPAHGGEARAVLAWLRARSAELGADVRVHDELGVIDLPVPPDRAAPAEPAPANPSPGTPPEPLRVAPLACTAKDVPAEVAIAPEPIGPLTLVGVSVEPPTITERGMLWIDTYWTTDAPVPADLWISLTGLPAEPGGTGPWRGNHEPCDWMWPTSRWEPGVIYHDRYGVRPPRELASGELEIRVGLRLDDEPVGDDVTVARVPIVADPG